MAEFLHGVEIITLESGVRPIQLASTSVIGVAGTAPEANAAAFPLDEPVLVTSLAEAAGLGDTGTLPDALSDIFTATGAAVVVVRVKEEEAPDETLASIAGGVDAETGKYLGVQAFLAAAGSAGVKPRILVAPGFTHQRLEDPANEGTFLANPVAAALVGVAEKLRAVVVVDGPNTNDADAQAARNNFGSKRVLFHDPWYQFLDTTLAGAVVRPASAKIAAVIAENDNRRGWHTSPSNQLVPGILGLSREIDFTLGDANSRANLLNAGDIATTIQEGGFRLWGNRTTSDDPKWAFLAHVRIADIINDSLLAAHLWAVDRNITKTYIEDVVGGVQAFIDRLIAEGRIAGGKCWAPPELNTAADMIAGRAVFDFDFAPYGIAERITFRSRVNNDYLEELLNA